jgi:hypothetical protein
MVPKREVWEVAGASTRLLNWSRTRPKTTGTVPVLLLMVPGNPGVIEYYETFLNEVHRRCDGSVEVMGGMYLSIAMTSLYMVCFRNVKGFPVQESYWSSILFI